MVPRDSSRPLLTIGLLALPLAWGCAQRDDAATAMTSRPPTVIVVSPTINLSGGEDFDPLKVTDILASEFLSFAEVSVVPVNLALAALARRGKTRVETAEEALALAEELGADATIVMAVTEYNPYDPPSVGLVMQWYGVSRRGWGGRLDPVAASRRASPTPFELSAADASAPQWQVQRVFNAAQKDVLEDVKAFAAQRPGARSPYDWRRYTKSQELYVRYCCWAMIRTMLSQNDPDLESERPTEVSR